MERDISLSRQITRVEMLIAEAERADDHAPGRNGLYGMGGRPITKAFEQARELRAVLATLRRVERAGGEAEAMSDFALALHHPDGSRAWWTGGVRLADGEFVPELGAQDAAWRFATPGEAAETLDGFRQVFQPGPQLARLAVADLTEAPPGDVGGGAKLATVKTVLGKVFTLKTAGP